MASLDVAIRAGNLAMVSKLLDQGAPVEIEFESWYVSCDTKFSKAENFSSSFPDWGSELTA